MAADTEPLEILLHLPLLCEDKVSTVDAVKIIFLSIQLCFVSECSLCIHFLQGWWVYCAMMVYSISTNYHKAENWTKLLANPSHLCAFHVVIGTCGIKISPDSEICKKHSGYSYGIILLLWAWVWIFLLPCSVGQGMWCGSTCCGVCCDRQRGLSTQASDHFTTTINWKTTHLIIVLRRYNYDY
jgi:hypothetical protein